ncbi:hypothetical protein YC2023_035912 [Brassica napus]
MKGYKHKHIIHWLEKITIIHWLEKITMFGSSSRPSLLSLYRRTSFFYTVPGRFVLIDLVLSGRVTGPIDLQAELIGLLDETE